MALHTVIYHDGGNMQILVKRGDKGSTVPLSELPEDATVDDLFALVEKELGPDGSWFLVYSAKNLDEERGKKKKLTDCCLQDKSTVYLVFRVKGGRNPDEKAELEAAMNAQKSGLRPLSGWVTLSAEDCMILADSPEPGQYNAKIKCGHVISPPGMTAHALSLVQEGRYQFHCPLCQKEWPFFVVQHVGSFTATEKKNVESRLAENYMEKALNVQKCPKCQNYCFREDKNNQRAVCPVCTTKDQTNYEFCWACLKQWIGSGRTCGNDECDGSDPRNHYLKDCPEVEIKYSKIKCPSIRACPGCGVLITYVDLCKEMHCPQCKVGFCFVCLQQNKDGQLKCGSYSSKCEKAPIQKF